MTAKLEVGIATAGPCHHCILSYATDYSESVMDKVVIEGGRGIARDHITCCGILACHPLHCACANFSHSGKPSSEKTAHVPKFMHVQLRVLTLLHSKEEQAAVEQFEPSTLSPQWHAWSSCPVPRAMGMLEELDMSPSEAYSGDAHGGRTKEGG